MLLQGRLVTLQESKQEGKDLTKDQLQAIEKLPEVSIQLDIVKELQKQFLQLQAEVLYSGAHLHMHGAAEVLYSGAHLHMHGAAEVLYSGAHLHMHGAAEVLYSGAHLHMHGAALSD